MSCPMDEAALQHIDILVRGATPAHAHALKQLIVRMLLGHQILATTDEGFVFDESPTFWKCVEALRTRGRIAVLDAPKP